MNNGETWAERNDSQRGRTQAPAAFIQEELLIIRHLCEIAIYDLQTHFPIFVQMLSIIQAMLHTYIFCPNGRKREGYWISALLGFVRGSVLDTIFLQIQNVFIKINKN